MSFTKHWNHQKCNNCTYIIIVLFNLIFFLNSASILSGFITLFDKYTSICMFLCFEYVAYFYVDIDNTEYSITFACSSLMYSSVSYYLI